MTQSSLGLTMPRSWSLFKGRPIGGFCVNDLLCVFMEMHVNRHVQFLSKRGDPREWFVRHGIGCMRAKGSAD